MCPYQPCSLCSLSKIAQCPILALLTGNGYQDNVGGKSGGERDGRKNCGIWGVSIVEGDGLVGSVIRGVIVHIAAFVF